MKLLPIRNYYTFFPKALRRFVRRIPYELSRARAGTHDITCIVHGMGDTIDAVKQEISSISGGVRMKLRGGGNIRQYLTAR